MGVDIESAYTTDIQVRFRDIDPLSHVSHTVYLDYMQQARLEFSEEVLGLGESAYDTVVAHVEIDYEGEVLREDDVTVETWITEVGSSSFTMAYAILADGDRAATGESVQVLIDVETGDTTEVPPEWRETFDRYRPDGEGADAGA
jgi:acyl-CoA thioester hydrolase